ncbi:MAG: universal stress protein [Candidatus Aeolococcus gillhamiae]|uniref:Universal stress protein n=1 Tax=Candidatus Aeolococcus gillhamiae TaxID=3127015 RepID=A0A2W5Z3H8_9BACT|nr:MAG: universal stress protein [Candidatus Dormibacter sp. RRmetagenome_bin12]
MSEIDTTAKPVVVVGVDGSAGARAALRWALAEARLRQAPLRIVHAWTYGFAGGAAAGDAYFGYLASYPPLGNDVTDALRQAAEDVLTAAIAEVVDGDADVQIERQLIEGGPAQILVGAVGHDDLLVVGSRGHGGFADLLLGSVSLQCVHHAPCPVVVVHLPKEAPADHNRPAAGGAATPRS